MARRFTEALGAASALAALWWALAPGAVRAGRGAITIRPEQAESHLGERVRVELRLGPGAVRPGRAEFEAGPLRLVVPALVAGPSAEEIAHRFGGRRVRVEGRLDDLGGELELLVSGPADVAPLEAEAQKRREEPPGVDPTPVRGEPLTGCDAARRLWRVQAGASPLDDLELCLAHAAPGCTEELASARRWIDRMGAAAARVRRACRSRANEDDG